MQGLKPNVTYFSRLRLKNLAWDSSFLYPIRLAGRSAVSCDTEAWPCRCNPTYDRKLSGVLLDWSYRVGPTAQSPNHTPGQCSIAGSTNRPAVSPVPSTLAPAP